MVKAGAIGKSLGIAWGEDWKEKNTLHFQISKNWVPPATKLQEDAYTKAVQKLVDKQVISLPTLWISDTFTKENAHSLIIKVANMK